MKSLICISWFCKNFRSDVCLMRGEKYVFLPVLFLLEHWNAEATLKWKHLTLLLDMPSFLKLPCWQFLKIHIISTGKWQSFYFRKPKYLKKYQLLSATLTKDADEWNSCFWSTKKLLNSMKKLFSLLYLTCDWDDNT